MEEEILERIEKQMEGSNLALSAVAEVLHKMDARLSKEDERDEEEEAEEEEKMEKATLVKSIATEVFAMIKADNGMDVDGTKVRAGTKMNGSTDDKAVTVSSERDISDVQATIQAMQKEDGNGKEYPGEENEEEEDAKENPFKSKSSDYESMTKQLEGLQKQLASYEATMQKQVQGETEERLRKMGFREEGGTIAPKRIENLGTDGTTPLVKQENSDDVADQLANLSYKELRMLQTRVQAGDTEGIPQELL
jgi:hypothetical protein